MRKFTISQTIVAQLARHGVDRIFLVPGGGNMFLVDAAGSHETIEVVATHHEQAAVIAAEYYARVSGKLGVAIVTTGPGSSNAVTGIAGAWFDSIPILILAGQVKTADYNSDGRLRQRGPQEIDLISMVQKITKYQDICLNPQKTLSQLETAISLATSGRPGPSVLEIPLDIQSTLLASEEPVVTTNKSPKEQWDMATYSPAIDTILSKLATVKKPLLVIGGGIRAAQVVNQTREIVSKLRIPCSLTWRTTDFLPFEHELNAGRFGSVAKRHSNILIQKADFILVLGSRLDATQTAHNLPQFGKKADIFMVDVDNAELQKTPKRFTKYNLDLRAFIPLFLEKTKNIEQSGVFDNWLKEVSTLKNKFADEQFNNNAESRKSISVYQVVNVFSEIFKGGELIITGSSGLAIEVFYSHFRNKMGQCIHLTTGLGAMGYGLPGLLGASEATSEKTFLLESDGSLMMNVQELQSIKTRGRNTVVFVLNNKGYASIRATQQNYFNSRFVATGQESGLDIPEIEKIASCFGFKFIRASKIQDLKTKIKKAITSDGPTICEIEMQPDEKLMPKCGVLKADNNSLLSAPLEDMNPLLSIEELNSVMENEIDEISLKMRNLPISKSSIDEKV